MTIHEAHAEHLIGARVRDADGRIVGRIEEMLVEIVDGDYVVTEFHLGSAALFERIAGFATALPFFKALGRPSIHRVRWDDLDLSEPRRPRLRPNAYFSLR